jgi:hypothetical protein
MGFFDARCMITGVSLKGSEAALVLLQQHEESYHPIALAITGQYDRLGSIDGIDEDENTDLVLDYFLNQLAEQAFVVDVESLRIHESYPIATIEQLLRGFERNMNDGPGYAVLNGQPVVFALVSATVWRAIARTSSPHQDDATFHRLFGANPVPLQIYGGHLKDVSCQLGEFAAVSDFLAPRGLLWTPPTDWGQHYPDDMREYLAEARTAFHDSSLILQALRQYEIEFADLLED